MKKLIVIIVLTTVLLSCLAKEVYRMQEDDYYCLYNMQPFDFNQLVEAEVKDVVDGDTFKVEILNYQNWEGLNQFETVRIIGIDTPETVHPTKPKECYGDKATMHAKLKLLFQHLYLGFDETIRDRYNRILCYVFNDNGACINTEILEQGLARGYYKYPFVLMEHFKKFEQSAIDQDIGLWRKCK